MRHKANHQPNMDSRGNFYPDFTILQISTMDEGGAEQVALAGLRRFHAFPACPSKERLGTYIGEWQHLRNKHGAGIPDESLYVMLINMLPEEVAKEVRDRNNTLSPPPRASSTMSMENSRICRQTAVQVA